MLETAARRDGFRKAEIDRRVAYQRGEITAPITGMTH
jgi:hypothetical protein